MTCLRWAALVLTIFWLLLVAVIAAYLAAGTWSVLDSRSRCQLWRLRYHALERVAGCVARLTGLRWARRLQTRAQAALVWLREVRR